MAIVWQAHTSVKYGDRLAPDLPRDQLRLRAAVNALYQMRLLPKILYERSNVVKPLFETLNTALSKRQHSKHGEQCTSLWSCGLPSIFAR